MHKITASAGEVVDSTAADSRGRFTLSMDASDDPAALYAAAALNDGLSYFGPALHPGMELLHPVNNESIPCLSRL